MVAPATVSALAAGASASGQPVGQAEALEELGYERINNTFFDTLKIRVEDAPAIQKTAQRQHNPFNQGHRS